MARESLVLIIRLAGQEPYRRSRFGANISPPNRRALPIEGEAVHTNTACQRPLILCFVMALGICALSGCAVVTAGAFGPSFSRAIDDPNKFSAAELEMLKGVRVYSSEAGLHVTARNSLEGLACRRRADLATKSILWEPAMSDITGRTPEEVAMTQLRWSAAKSGANAVVAPTCTHHGYQGTLGCVESWVCAGTAVQIN